MQNNDRDTEDYNKARSIAESLADLLKQDDIARDPSIDNWLNENPFAEEIVQNFGDTKYLTEKNEWNETILRERKERVAKLNAELQRKHKIARRRLLISISSAAAAVLLASFLFYTSSHEVKPPQKTSVTYVINQTTDNPNTAPKIILSNGENIELNQSSDTISFSEGTIVKSGNTLICSDIDKMRSGNAASYNILMIPNSSVYTITLTDGTEVTLNANSSLRYPVTFVGDKREVFLTGEAYFKVKKSKIPFIVHSSAVEIKVYGTEFNVNAYESNIVKTVLIEGKVGIRINDNKDAKELIMKPDQMVVSDYKKNTQNLTEVNCSRYIAWKNGYFRSDNELLISLLNDVSKWYNVSFKYDRKEFSTIRVSASLGRDLPLEEILKAVEILSDVKFIKMEGGAYQIE